MADNHSTPRLEIAKRFLGLSNQFSGPQRIPYDEEQHANHEFHLELIGSPKSWILLDCPNRLVDRYDPKELPDQLDNMPKTPTFPLYVGIDIFSLHPVFLQVATEEMIPGSSNASRSVIFRAVPTDGYKGKMRRIVLHEYFLKDGALGFTQLASMGDPQVLSGVDRSTAWSAFLAQITDIKNGEPVKPFEHPEHRNLPISHSIIEHDAVYTEMESPYMLRLPRLTDATLTPRLIELAMDLQRLLHQDNIHLNEIIMATFVWCDHESDPTRRIERALFEEYDSYADPDADFLQCVPRVGLIDFVAIWPHYLRFHEMHKLGTYIHPLRFVGALKNTAREAHPVRTNRWFLHQEKYHAWEEVAMREVACSRLDHDEGWCVVVPALLSGSLLNTPIDWSWLLYDLEKTLALPDIHMIGHPAYPVGYPTITQVITPLPWINPVVDRTQAWWDPQPNRSIVMESSITTQRGLRSGYRDYVSLRLISGDQLSVAGPPKVLEPTEDPYFYEVANRATEEDEELHPDKILSDLPSVEQSAWRKKALETRLSMARESGITIEALGVDELGLPTWPGIAACAVARLKRGLGASR